MDSVIKSENLYFSYFEGIGDKNSFKNWVLKGINFSINKGEFIVIAGANGSGKSTLLRLIDLLLEPTKGRLYLFGVDTSLIKDPYEIRSRIGFVFQNPKHQIITSSVLDEITFGPENLGLRHSEIKERVEQSVALTGINDLLERRTDELSGGQKQLVAIASVLAMNPEILLFDEPTSMLHPEYHNMIIEIIKNLNKLGKTVLMVTHNSDDFTIGDRCFVIKRGDLIYDSDLKKFFENCKNRNCKEIKNIMGDSGLEVPFSIRVSLSVKEKIKEFPLCINIDELSDNLIELKWIK